MIKLKSIIQEILNEMPLISRKGKKDVYADNVPLKTLKLDDVIDNIIILRQPEKGGFIPFGWTLLYFMDSKESATEIANLFQTGKLNYLLIPVGTFHSGGSPIFDVWKKRFHKPGYEHILGLLQAHSDDEVIYLDMLSIRPGYRRNSIGSKLISMLKSKFPNAKISHSDPTDQGESFLKSTGHLNKPNSEVNFAPRNS